MTEPVVHGNPFRGLGPMRVADAQTGRPYSVDKQLIV
jgi:hypothetical protein